MADSDCDAPRKRRKADVPTRRIMPCRNIAEYVRLNHIEEGSYGIVFRAREIATGEIVAVKQLKLGREVSGGFPITSLREICTLMRVRHENVVTVREVSFNMFAAKFKVCTDDDGGVYLVMEFVEHDLKTLIGEMRDTFAMSEVKTLLKQLISATAALHDAFIVHRDIKTTNLLMTNSGMLKLADFGLARTLLSRMEDQRLTQLVTTLWYR